jgi:hypothetical protein
MNKAKRNNILALAFALALLPGIAFAQSTVQATTATGQTAGTVVGVPEGFSGIFSCNQTGANAMSVGALGATDGVYVPVADATVELNTGTLVYKECILREVVDAQRQAATAGFIQQGTNQVLTGRATANGNAPEYVVNQGQELTAVRTNAIVSFLQNGVSSLDPAIQTQVKNAIAQGYSTATYNAGSMLTCPYPGATTDFTSANPQGNIWNDILAVGSPCNPLFGYIDAEDLAMGQAAQEAQCQQDQWQWGGGFYAVTSGTQGPCENSIQTPSSEVNGLYSQLLQSPFNQLQNANDLGQMVGALFAGISTDVLSGTAGGVSGLTQPIGSSGSYLQQAVNQTSQNLQQQVSNAALANLDSALKVEESYYSIMSSIAATLAGARSQLQGAENSCWQQVIQKVCATPLSANGTCTAATACTTDPTTGTQTCPTGQTLHVATSTEFSQPVIDSQITSLASTAAQNLVVSQQALALINQLIQNVSGTSADSQAVAVQQLNTLEANNELHSTADLTTAQTQEQAVQSAMTTLTQNTPELWAGSDPNNSSPPAGGIPWNGSKGATLNASSPGVGWCNFQNQTTLSAWEQIW